MPLPENVQWQLIVFEEHDWKATPTEREVFEIAIHLQVAKHLQVAVR